MSGKEELIGSLGVGVNARTKNFHKKMRKARKEPGKFRKAVETESAAAGSAWSRMQEKMGKATGTVSFGMQQASAGMLQFTDAANSAGAAASGVGGIIDGAFSAGVAGAAFAGITAIFGHFAAESRKAEEAAAAAAEKRAERIRQLAERGLAEAKSVHDRMRQMREARADADFRTELDARAREAKAAGQHFDRTLQLELRASAQALKERKRMLADEEAALLELQTQREQAAGADKAAIAEAIHLRKQNVALLREEIRAEQQRPDAAKAASAARERAKHAADLAAATERAYQKALEEQRARSASRIAMREAVEEAERLVNLTEEERQDADRIAQIRKAEALGLRDVADRLRRLLEYDKARAKHAKDLAAHQTRSQRGQNLDKQLRQRERLAKATGEAERFAVQQQGEYLRLLAEGADRAQVLNTLQAERLRWSRQQTTQANETVESLRHQVALAKAATDEQRQQIQRQKELNETRRRGGEEAVKLQQQLNALADQAAQKAEQAAKRQARMSDAGMGNRLSGGLDADGNFQGLGLAAARQARRDANRSRKRRRAHAARSRAIGTRSIHDGMFSGLGGIRSGAAWTSEGLPPSGRAAPGIWG